MLKDSDITRHTARSTYRTNTPAFKAELVAACQQPGTFIAALTSSHGMNANMLHRLLKEHARKGCHHPAQRFPAAKQPSTPDSSPSVPGFGALRMTIATPDPVSAELKVALRKGALSMTVT